MTPESILDGKYYSKDSVLLMDGCLTEFFERIYSKSKYYYEVVDDLPYQNLIKWIWSNREELLTVEDVCKSTEYKACQHLEHFEILEV